ncbi:MAG: porin [Haliangium ochraceum]
MDSPPEAPPPAPAYTAETAAAVDAIDQQARIANRKIELLEEQLAAKAKDAVAVSADDKGFSSRSSDAAYVLRVRGLLQADARFFSYDGALSDRSDTFLIRRFRPTLEGTLLGFVDFRLTPDFAGGTLAVFDAYADLRVEPWFRLRAGKFKSPLGLERLQSDPDVPLAERALTQYLTPTRDVGVALWGDVAGGLLVYSAGVFNGSPDNANQDLDANHAKDFALRILVQPLRAEGLQNLGSLGVHFAFSTGNRFGTPTNPQLPSFRSAGLNTFFSYLAPGAGTAADPTGSGTSFAHLRQTRFNPGLYYYSGPFGMLAEVVQSSQQVQKGNTTATLTHRAAHATLSVVLGGKNAYEGPTPTTAFNRARGTWGAVEIAVRWSYLRISDATFGDPSDATRPVFADPLRSARKAQGLGAALTFILSRTVRAGLTFERTTFTGGLAAADKKTVVDRKPENAILGRLQLNF